MRISLKHILGLVAFLISFVSYSLCVQPTVPFWDCGEFTAAAVHQQVPHPPGAPLFLMVGKLFHLIPLGDPAVRVNMVSVAASAATVLLLYFIIAMCIQCIRKKDVESHIDSVSVYGSAFVGAMAFCFSDTFWFNAVESEVYASSSLFVALVVYVMMRWNEEADKPGHERYLLMIAYLIGLSTGVHLLSVLTIFSLGLLIYFRKFSMGVRSFIIMGLCTLLVFAIVYPGVVKFFPALLSGNLPFKNEAHEYYVENELWVRLLGYGILIATLLGAYLGVRKKIAILALCCASFVAMFLGYTTYAHILIRSNANPPMNENAPKTFHGLISYLGREQYGDAPTFPRRFERDEDKVEAYKKYGPYTPPPVKHIESLRSPGLSYSVPDYDKVKSSSGDWNYLFNYQLDHMFLRYLLWNFVGRTSDVQDSEAWTLTSSKKYIEDRNFNTGYSSHFPITFFAIPFLFGLFGMLQHFRRDARMAVVFLTMFLMMGVIAAFAQNQQEPQPRERDYFYTGAFMIWCLWIGIATHGLVEYVSQKRQQLLLNSAVLLASLTLVPVSMASQGWFIHSRAGNFVPFDYSYNILQSCEQNGILFTNGDNDTFPCWLLQDVYGVRRDIRIVNLSLAGTLWYVNDLKNLSPWGAEKIPLTFSDESLIADEYSPKALSTKYGSEEKVSVEVDESLAKRFGMSVDSSRQYRMIWTNTGYSRGKGQYAFSVPQQVIRDIIQQTKFSRPVYFSMTCGYPTNELYCGLGDHCRLEGMAYRVCPMIVGEAGEAMDTDVMEKCLLQTKAGTEFSTDFSYGFKFRNLNNPDVYYDEVHRRYIDNYRTLFIRYANIALTKGSSNKAIAVLDSMNSYISPSQFPMSYALMQDVVDLYHRAGAKVQTKLMAQRVVDQCQQLIDKPYLQRHFPQFVERMPPALIASQSYEVMGDYNAARDMLMRFRDQTHDERGYELRLQKVNADELQSQGKYAEAIALLEKHIEKMQISNEPALAPVIAVFQEKISELQKESQLAH